MRGFTTSTPARGSWVHSCAGAGWHPDGLYLVFLFLASLATGLLWSFSIPFHGGPDEAAHFHVARFIQEHGRLPRFTPGEMWLYYTEVGAVESYATFPPLAYVLGAVLLPLFDGRFWGARAISLISYVGTVLMTFGLGRQLFPTNRSAAAAAALVVAFLPQMAFVGSYANNDALALFETAIMLSLLLTAGERPSPGGSAALGLVIGALLLTKYTFYAVAGVALIAGIWLCLRGQRRALCGVSLLASTLAACGWWFLRNWLLYGELIPRQVVGSAKEAAGGNTLVIAGNHGINMLSLSFATDFWPLTLKSFVASFGFETVFLEPWHYAACAAAALIGIAGWIRSRAWRRSTLRGRTTALVFGAMLLGTTGSAMAINVYGEWSAQGRYLFPALTPLAIGLVAGWARHGSGQLSRRWLPWVPVAGLVALNAICLRDWVVPAYFGDEPQHVILQIDSPSGSLQAGRPITIAGWSFLEAATSWQPLSPGAIAGYREPVDRIVVFVDGPPGTGSPLGSARYGVPRRDVSDYFGRARPLGEVGFEMVAPPGSLDRGTHSLLVCGYALTDPVPGCVERRIEVL